MSSVLTPGGNTPLTSSRVTVDVAAAKALDVSALLVTASGKVRSDADFVFFNAPEGPGVRYSGAGIAVDTGLVPGEIDRVVVTASLDGSATFAGTEPTATVRDSGTGEVLAVFTPPRLTLETALVVVELYRRGGQWKLRAVGQGYANGLAGIATDFGVTVDDPGPAAAAPAPAAQPVPQPTVTLTPAPPAPVQPAAAPPVAAQPVQPAPVQPAPSPYQQPQPPAAQPPVAPPPGFGPPPGYGDAPGYSAPPVQPPAPSQGWIPTSVPVGGAQPEPAGWQPPAPSSLPGSPQPYAAPSPAPAPAAPSASPASDGRVTLDKGRVSLKKGGSVSLVKNGQPVLSSVRMGLGWEPAHRGRNIDLDASVIAYDSRRKELDKVWFMHLHAFNAAIQHAGDNLTGEGAGDDEAITVHLQSLPAQVTALVFTVNSFSGQRFTDVANAYCRLLDATSGAELVRFDLTQAEPHTGVLMCKLVRMQSGEWVMTALEEYVDSKTVRGMVKPGAHVL